MGGEGQISATGIFRQPILEAPGSAGGNETNTREWQSGSNWSAAARVKLRIGLLGKVVQLAIGNVSFDLPIPRVRDEFLKPLGKSSQVRLRQPRHFRFQLLNAHGSKVNQGTPRSKRRATRSIGGSHPP
jgi:hypothetical protein